MANRDSLYLSIALLAIMASAAYWTAFGVHEYSTFQLGGSDLGVWSYNTYYDIHFFNAVQGLQLLEFGNHLSLEPLLLMPIFFLFQSIFTLMVVQILVLSLTALAVFLIVRSLTKNPLLGLALCLAFLLSPGIYGIYIYGFHPESFLLLPYLVAFYAYMKMNKKLFFAATLLLLATLEVAPFMAVTLGAGLLLFGFLYTKDSRLRKERVILSLCLIVLSLAALLAYGQVTNSLLASEGTGHYANLPPLIKLVPFESQQTSGAAHIGSSISADAGKLSLNNLEFVAYALWVAFLGFGIAVLLAPELALVFGLQWLGELFIVKNYNFTLAWYPYFSFVLGGTMVAVILGLKLAEEGRGASKLIVGTLGKDHRKLIMAISLVALLISVVALNILYPYFVTSKAKSSIFTNFTEDFLLQTSPQQSLMYRQLGSVVNKIPRNSTVMTQFYIVPHLMTMADLELIPNSTSGLTQHNFIPQYIVVDFNTSVVPYVESSSVTTEAAAVASYMNSTGGYSLYAQNGSALLYKRG